MTEEKLAFATFQHDMAQVVKSLFSLSSLHSNLFKSNSLKIINRQQLSQNPYIRDEISSCKEQLRRAEQEFKQHSSDIAIIVEKYAVHSVQISAQTISIIQRVIQRVLEMAENEIGIQKIEYYQYYKQKFEDKCKNTLEDIANIEIYYIIKMLYKYFRHITMVEVERCAEILDCIEQNDFQSLKHFREYFYAVILKKEQSKKQKNEEKIQKHTNFIACTKENNNLNKNLLKGTAKIEVIDLVKQEMTNEPIIQYLPKQKTVNQLDNKIDIKPLKQGQIIRLSPEQLQMKSNGSDELIIKPKSTKPIVKRLFTIINQTMPIHKDHFISASQSVQNKSLFQKSMLSQLKSRNKINITQIQNYFEKCKKIDDFIKNSDLSQLYYYSECHQPEQIKQISVNQENRSKDTNKIIFNNLIKDKQFATEIDEKQKEKVQRKNNKFDHKVTRTIHKSIECKPKKQLHHNFEEENREILQKPLKIDSDFLTLNLNKPISKAKRETRFEQMVSRASSLGNLRFDLNHKRIKVGLDKFSKITAAMFKSSKIIHQNDLSEKQVGKLQKQIVDYLHHKTEKRLIPEFKATQNQQLGKNVNKFCEIKKMIV